MDGDLQHPPEVVPKMFADWRSGSKIVLTKRITDQPGSRFKNWASNSFYKVFSSVAETKIEPGTSDFRLLDRQALKELLRLNYGEPFLRGAVHLLGFPTSTVEFAVGTRFAGESKYTLRKMLRFARHGLISHSAVPLRLGIWIGLVTGALSVLELAYVVTQFALGNTVPGWASTLGLMSFLFAVLFITVGIMGLYLEDIHKLLKARPHFIIAEMTPRAPAAQPHEHRRVETRELWEEKL
jgi:dolichol-phosphate mannosyltransferase